MPTPTNEELEDRLERVEAKASAHDALLKAHNEELQHAGQRIRLCEAMKNDVDRLKADTRAANELANRSSQSSIDVEHTTYAAILEVRRDFKENMRKMQARLEQGAAASKWKRTENRGWFVAIAILLFVGFVVLKGEAKGGEIVAMVVGLCGAMALFLQQLTKAEKRDKNSLVPPPPDEEPEHETELESFTPPPPKKGTRFR